MFHTIKLLLLMITIIIIIQKEKAWFHSFSVSFTILCSLYFPHSHVTSLGFCPFGASLPSVSLNLSVNQRHCLGVINKRCVGSAFHDPSYCTQADFAPVMSVHFAAHTRFLPSLPVILFPQNYIKLQ